MIGRIGIAALIPHALGMCLLDTVEDWDEQSILCSAVSHRSERNPLRSAHQLTALNLCEYGAQAMAVHGGLLAQREHGGKAAAGMLVSLRDVVFTVDRIDNIDASLTVTAHRKFASPGGALYDFEISAHGCWLAHGRVSVIHSRLV